MRSLLVVLLTLAVAGVAAPARLSKELHPSWSPTGSRLVFESDRYGSADVFVLDLGSGEVRRLTDSPAEDARPVWSPDGQRIAFHSNREGNYDLYLIRPDGTDLVRVTESELDETNAAWSPSSDALVYEIRSEERHWVLGLLSLSDRSTRRLLDRPGDHLTPTWLPTGEIAFTYSPPGGNHDTDVVIMMAGVNGQVLGELLAGARGNSNAHYSAVRGRVVFNSIRDGNWEIYTAGLHGEGERRLTFQAQPDLAGVDGQPEWSPAGDRIAITSGRAGSLDIVLIDPDGTELRNLTGTWTSE